MALRNCVECGKQVSSDAKSCPECGAPVKKRIGCLKIVGGITIACIALFIICGIIGSQLDTSSPGSLPTFGKTKVTLAEYERVKTGMSYSEVVKIIGTAGEEITHSKMDGVPGVMESIETVMYQWVNGNGSNMNAMFQNNKLVQKAQLGLK